MTNNQQPMTNDQSLNSPLSTFDPQLSPPLAAGTACQRGAKTPSFHQDCPLFHLTTNFRFDHFPIPAVHHRSVPAPAVFKI